MKWGVNQTIEKRCILIYKILLKTGKIPDRERKIYKILPISLSCVHVVDVDRIIALQRMCMHAKLNMKGSMHGC